MTAGRTIRGLLSWIMAGALLLHTGLPAAYATDSTEEPLPLSTIAEETIPPETTVPLVTEQTQPPETAAPTIPETLPEEESLPPETAPVGTLPEETIPEETISEETTPEETVPEETVLEENTAPAVLDASMVSISALPENGCLAPGEGITLSCSQEEAALYYALSSDGETFSDFLPYTGCILPMEAGQPVFLRAYALLDGQKTALTDFYFESEAPAVQSISSHWNFYFGLLHAHSSFSSSDSSVSELFSQASQTENLDFFAVTDTSHSLDNADAGALATDGSEISEEWREGKEAAKAATDADFVGIYGYELTIEENRNCRISTFCTPGWQTRNQDEGKTFERYYDVLTTVPNSISQFVSPDSSTGYFDRFGHHSAARDKVIQLIEITKEAGKHLYDAYLMALNQGWHLAPSCNQNGLSDDFSGDDGRRTVVLAQELTEDAIYDAIRNHRVYATEDPDLQILYRMDGYDMGSILHSHGQEITLSLLDPTDSGNAAVELVHNGTTIDETGIDTASGTLSLPVPPENGYFFLKITQTDGDLAVTAPIWVDSYADLGIRSFTASETQPLQGQEVTFFAEFFNEETVDLTITALEATLNGVPIYTMEESFTVPAAGSVVHEFSCTHEEAGSIEVQLSAEGNLNGEARSWTAEPLQLIYQVPQPLLSDIRDIRSDELLGQAVLVVGNVTAGTSRVGNSFPDTIYIQDKTGGIPVVDFSDPGIPLGASMEVVGIVEKQAGNYVLKLLNYVRHETDLYSPDPDTLPNEAAMDYETHGGEFLQVQGTVMRVYRSGADLKTIEKLLLKDSAGNLAQVWIEPYIVSGESGINDLHKEIKPGRTVRARGLLHMHNGAPVLRVRDCDEVVYVPPIPDPTNPKTADGIFLPLAVMSGSLTALFLLLSRRKRA